MLLRPPPGPAPARVASLYRHYAEQEAPGRSPLFGEFAAAVARDERTLAFLAARPERQWQPNLLIAAVRYLYGTPPHGAAFTALVHAHEDDLAELMDHRRTQTNEPARCATLLPVLARLPQPLALLEVGASAGLCLWPDYYGYDYGGVTVAAGRRTGVSPPVFRCRADAATPLPERPVDVAWRAGLDLHPIDLHDEAEVRWLEALVWPGQDERLADLRQACAVARELPSPVREGDLRTDLAALAAQAPAGATLVVFHTAVLAYVADEQERAQFATTVAGLGAVWLANEGPRYIPGLDAGTVARGPQSRDFLLCVDGRPVARTDGHGGHISWLAD